MRKQKNTDAQIVAALKNYEEGKDKDKICRSLKINTTIFKSWRNKFTGLDVKQVRQYREMERTISKLKEYDLGLQHEIEILNKVFERLEIDPVVSMVLLMGMYGKREKKTLQIINGFGIDLS
jgi:putative transposase